MKSRAGMILLALGWWCGVGRAATLVPVPPLTAHVIDLTGTLSGATVARLEGRLAALESHKGDRIAVLMVPTTQPEDIARFSARVARAWQLDRKAAGDGAILIIAKHDRRVRIEVGRGIERWLSDAVANRIVSDTITPHFRARDFDGGVEAGVSQMIAVISGEPLPPSDQRRWNAARSGHRRLLYPLLLVVVLVGSGWLHALAGRLLGGVATGALAGALAGASSHALLVGVAAGVLSFAWSMTIDAGRRWTSGVGWGALDTRREVGGGAGDLEFGGGASGSW
ncbi:MAG TPA: TPM domain-containing protein [Steroidobacteraceae bacterium]|nr:TPM domain-containing protein [Steroidobacteraceae bacterium]